MAGKCLPGLSVFLVLVLSIFLLLESSQLHPTVPKGAMSMMLGLKLDEKQFPGRNTPGLPRRTRCGANLPPSLKLKIGLHFVKASMVASCLVLLAGDVSLNPGPSGVSFNADKFPRARGFKMAHLNVRSMVNKMDEIRLLIQDKPFDIFTVSETWLTPSILDSEVGISGYTLIRRDRSNKRGGGVAIFIRDGIPYRHRSDFSDKTETCWIEINRPKCKKLFVCCAYRAPDFCCDSFIEHLNGSISGLPAESEIAVLGDFNADFLSKRNEPAYKQKQKLSRFARMNDLEQLINTPTRICNQTRTVIDLIFVNNNHRVVESGVIHSALSDHFIVYCTMKSGVPRAPPKTIEYRSYRTYDKDAFVRELRMTDWSALENNEDVESAVKAWNSLFSLAANRHAPIKRSRVKGIQTPWMTSDLRNAMRDRDYHHRKAVKTNSEYHWKLFKKTKAYVNKQVKKCKADYYLDLINKNKENTSALWKTLNNITSRKTNTPISSIEVDGVPYTDVKSIAEVLNSHFTLIGSKLAAKIKEKVLSSAGGIFFSPSSRSSSEYEFSFSSITQTFVFKQLRALKTNKAIGLDRISARLLKDSAQVMAPKLTMLFNRSLSSSIFPSIWKQGKVTALFKAGHRTDCNNYRPITVLPTVSKILERAVHQQLYGYLSENNLLTPKQFGFRPKLSTVTALAHFTDNILQNLDNSCITGAVFLDLSKAFDTVDHELLVTKLKSIGACSQVIKWFVSYLQNRHQVTSVGNLLSSCREVRVGVPQGSILGPLLFLLYVNDLPECLQRCEVVMYADDTVIYYSSKSSAEIEMYLNEELAKLTQWFNINRLTLNISKSKFMLFGNSRKLQNCSDIKLVIDNKRLEETESIKYLGVVINKAMTWHEQIETTIAKVNQRLGLLKRVRHLLPFESRITLYNALINPLLDYADVIWGDKNNAVLMEELQIMQNKAAKVILNLPIYASATSALETLGWSTLSKRRHIHRLIIIFKYVNELVNCNFIILRNGDIHHYNTRRRKDIRLPHVKRNYGKQRLLYQGFKEWNNLDLKLREIESLSAFKQHFKEHF